jgi:adenylosuccinate synthase
MGTIILTVDLGFGDAGKGSLVDFLTRTHGAHTVVRYNGGAQAAHRVVLAGDQQREHIFSQFGSGTLAGAGTHLSRFMLLDPPAMLAEEAHLRELGISDAFAGTTIEAGTLVITPFGRAINRLRELARGGARHGSCGLGIGETVADRLRYADRVLYAGDLRDPAVVTRKLRFLHGVALEKLRELRPALPDSPAVARELEPLHDPSWVEWLVECYAEFARRARIVGAEHLRTLLMRPGTVIFEGAQGVLLDEWYGFHPYTTWSTTTLANADRLLAEAGHAGPTTRIGITRAYATRHGCGPLPTEDAALTHALPDARNLNHPWQQGFRVGWLDLVLLRYAMAIVGPLDCLALTCVDRLEALRELWICRRYRHSGAMISHLPTAMQPSLEHQERLTGLLMTCRPELAQLDGPEALPTLLNGELGLPVGLISTGPTAADKRLCATPRRGRGIAESCGVQLERGRGYLTDGLAQDEQIGQ